MPVMKPEHQQAMRNAQKILAEVGVEGAKSPAEDSPDSSPVISAMNRAGLSLEEIIEELAIKVKSGNEGIAARAIDTALKMHGALKEAAVGPAAPSFTIVIHDPKTLSQSPSADLNIPAGVNPIFLPRQLQTDLKSTN